MRKEKSCGAVVYTRCADGIKYILIRSISGEYGFPKGHVEDGESEEETALREVREETSLKITLDPGFRMQTEYTMPRRGILKRVVYFLGSFKHQRFRPQAGEVTSIALLPYAEARKRLTHENTVAILDAAEKFLISGGKDGTAE